MTIPENQDAACRTLTMQVSGATRSALNLEKESTLKLGDGSARTSFVHGDITVGSSNIPVAQIRIDGDHTITGIGGTINVRHKGQIVPETGSGDTLIITGDTGCTGYPDSRDCSLTILGAGFVLVPLDNRAFVVGTGGEKLSLDTYDMTGTSTGHRVAEGDGGLEFGNEVTGACKWEISSDALNSVIFIGSSTLGDACVRGAGPTTLESGYLTIQDGSSFCTTGKLTWRSVEGDPATSPQIVTSGTASATFGLGGASPCAACD
ncbi:MAG: hypothetical protein BroJett003_18550 [Planctomycetota bacterium]|nr:MAG: hypothetical protein BroJett003_18550 [Planctomycetota bacterium]